MSHLMCRIMRARALSSLLSANPRTTRAFADAAAKDPAAAAALGAVSSEANASGEKAAEAQTPVLEEPAGGKRSFGWLKFGAFAALTGATGAVGYYSYAYSLDELEHMTKDFRKKAYFSAQDYSSSSSPEKADFSAQDNSSSSFLEKAKAFLKSGAWSIAVKPIEFYLDTRAKIEDEVRGFTEPLSEKLLPDLHPQEQHVFTLVLDLQETLIYSDWRRERGWRTFKRPGLEAFLERLAKFYEIVVYSDQLPMFVDPVIDRLDQKGCIRYRLSRPATKYIDGKHFRDLSKLNRDPSRIIYISGHALESCLQPENAVPIKPWKMDDNLDTELLDLLPFLEYVALHRPADIRAVLQSYQGHDIPKEFLERSKEHQRRMQGQKKPGLLGKW
ncbi:mitochondrial import inner membrane translocase subunit TIM50 [Carex littledalei]|uniref:Mitochondrial import inner membrane translocase subunit TIM50 n=1 Tax=Carex littledalei TaxID=544730 RepID=A0A833QX06_9POAL|nr:mitochondrial import inner membrane translocase subunit TIM50 [Carex littledalei]